MASNKRTAVSICIAIVAVTFSLALNGSGARSTISSRDNVTKPNVSAEDPVTRSTISVTDPLARPTMAVTEPVARSSMTVTGPVTKTTIVVTDPVTRSTVSAEYRIANSTLAIKKPVTRSTLAITEPVTTSNSVVTDHVTRSPVSATDALDRTSPVYVTDALDRTSPVYVTDALDRTSPVYVTDALDRTSPVYVTDALDRTFPVYVTDAPDRTSPVSVTHAPDRTSPVSLTDAPDRTSTVSLTDAPDRTSTVSLTDAPDRTSTVSLTDVPDRTSTVPLTDVPDRTSTVSPTDAPDRTATVSPTDAPDRTSTMSLTDVPDRTSTVSLIDAPDRTSTVSVTHAPDRTSKASAIGLPSHTVSEGNPSASSVKHAVLFTTDYVRTTFVPETTSRERWVTTPPQTFWKGFIGNGTGRTPIGGNSLDRLLNSVGPQRHPCSSGQVYYFKTPIGGNSLDRLLNSVGPQRHPCSSGQVCYFKTLIGGNSLDRLLNSVGPQRHPCSSGQVYYFKDCHVTWLYITPRQRSSTWKYTSAPSTSRTHTKPHSTTKPPVKPSYTTRKHMQSLTTSNHVKPPTTILVNSPSTARDSISSPSSPTRENDVIPINEPTLTPNPNPNSTPSSITHNYNSRRHNTTGTRRTPRTVDEDSSHEPSAVTTSTNTSPDHLLKTADTQSTTSRLQCNHIILNNSTFNMYPNGSIILKGGRVINESDFVLTQTGQLKVCVTALGSQGSNTKLKIDLNRPTVVLTNICLVSSQVFLLLTFIFHCFFPSLRNLPGVMLMFLSVSLFLAHATFFFGSAQAYNRTTCIAIGVVIHFFWLASFCWLNISSFHTFRVFKDVFASRSFESNKKTIILKYCIFGYGTPVVVIAATITANYFVSGSESFGYADTSNFCFVSNGTNSIVGLLVPAGVTILVSSTLFILTVVYLCRASANRRKIGNGEKWNILMYIKLSSITGFSRVFGFLQMVDRSSQVFTYLFICLTGAQGVFIFLAFMANKRTFLLVKHACRKQIKDATKYHVGFDVEDANKV